MMAFSMTPVCPTMSGGAKLHTMKGWVPALICATIASPTPTAFISGWRS